MTCTPANTVHQLQIWSWENFWCVIFLCVNALGRQIIYPPPPLSLSRKETDTVIELCWTQLLIILSFLKKLTGPADRQAGQELHQGLE